MIEIVFPKNNEKEFIKIAKKLGYNSLFFIYPLNSPFKQIKYEIEIKYGVITSDKNLKLMKTNLKLKYIGKFIIIGNPLDQ